MVGRNGLVADLFADAQTSFKAKLQSAVQRLAASNIFVGTSSWKYSGRCGQKETQSVKEGEWATLEIIVQGDKVEHKIGGETVRPT